MNKDPKTNRLQEAVQASIAHSQGHVFRHAEHSSLYGKSKGPKSAPILVNLAALGSTALAMSSLMLSELAVGPELKYSMH